jgi:hypothetical protein
VLDQSLHKTQGDSQRDFGHLAEAQIVTTRTVGRNRMVRANKDHPVFEPLSRVMEFTFGPAPIVAEAFAEVEADMVLIFGSWAARYHGEPGPPANDIDVLVIGKPARAEVLTPPTPPKSGSDCQSTLSSGQRPNGKPAKTNSSPKSVDRRSS